MKKKNIKLIIVDFNDSADILSYGKKHAIKLDMPGTLLDLRRFGVGLADGVTFYGAQWDADTEGNFDPVIAKVKQKYDPIHKMWIGLWEFDKALHYSVRKANGEDYWDDAVKEFEQRKYSKEEPEFHDFKLSAISELSQTKAESIPNYIKWWNRFFGG